MSSTYSADELLVAYLDNQLDPQQRQLLEQRLSGEPALAERLSLLARSNLPFKQAFEPLLDEAPVQRLRAEGPLTAPAMQHGVSRRGLIAAAVGFFGTRHRRRSRLFTAQPARRELAQFGRPVYGAIHT